MTDAPLSIDGNILSLYGQRWGLLPTEVGPVAAQLAAAARVPALEAEIERLRGEVIAAKDDYATLSQSYRFERSVCNVQAVELDRQREDVQRYNEMQFHASVERDAALAEVEELRARLDAAPDLTELRATREAMRKRTEFAGTAAFLVAVDRLLAAVPLDA